MGILSFLACFALLARASAAELEGNGLAGSSRAAPLSTASSAFAPWSPPPPEAPGVFAQWTSPFAVREDESGDECGRAIQHQYNCTEEACEDLVPGT